jgi:hypothetical protein
MHSLRTTVLILEMYHADPDHRARQVLAQAQGERRVRAARRALRRYVAANEVEFYAVSTFLRRTETVIDDVETPIRGEA